MTLVSGDVLAADPQVVGLIYEAALKPQLWELALQRLCELAKCKQAMLLAHHPAEAQITFFYSFGIAPEYLESFASRFAMVSPNVTKCFFNDLGIAQCSELFDDLTNFRNSLNYKEWCRPQGIERQCILMIVRDERKCGAIIVSLDSADDGDARRVLKMLNLYSEHLIRAVRIHNTLVEQAKAASAARGTLDRIDAPVLLLDEEGVIIAVNNKAQLTTSFAVGRTAQDALADVYCKERVASFFVDIRGKWDNQQWVENFVARPGQTLPHILTHMKLPKAKDMPEGFVFGMEPASLIMIHDTGAQKTVRPESFIQLFNLTPSEAQVLTLLARGMRLQDIAAHQGVAITTVRSQMASVMDKTGARRQADLVRVAVNSMLPVPFGKH